MSTILEVSKEYEQGWVRLGELGFGSSQFTNHTQNGEEILIVEPSKDGLETTIVQFLPIEHDIFLDVKNSIGGTLIDTKIETLTRGESMVIEATSPSGDKSRIIRLIQE